MTDIAITFCIFDEFPQIPLQYAKVIVTPIVMCTSHIPQCVKDWDLINKGYPTINS